jgi:hypothetical protein
VRRQSSRPRRYQKPNRTLGPSTAVLGRFWRSLQDLPFYCPPARDPGQRLPLVALVPWRQDYLNNRPPTRATAISAMGHSTKSLAR